MRFWWIREISGIVFNRFIRNIGIDCLVLPRIISFYYRFYTRSARGSGPQLWHGTSRFARFSGLTFKTLGAITLSQALITPSPIKVTAAQETPSVQEVQVQGIYRITRHAMFLSFAFLGLGNLFVRGCLSDIFFWSAFPAFWVVGSHHQDARMEKTMPKEFFEQTSLWPFQAVVEERQDLTKIKEEVNTKAIAIALMSPLFFLWFSNQTGWNQEWIGWILLDVIMDNCWTKWNIKPDISHCSRHSNKEISFLRYFKMANYGIFSVILILLALVVTALLFYFGNRKTFPWYVQATCFIAWFFPFTIIFILPLDLTSVCSINNY